MECLKSIYEWINPNDKFDPLEYLPSSQNPREIIEKRIKLENYFEDTVLRRLEPLDVNKVSSNTTWKLTIVGVGQLMI